MAKEETVERAVAHPKIYLRVDGRLQRVAPGTKIPVTEAQIKTSGTKLVDPSGAKQLKDGKLTEGEAEQLAALKAENAALKESDNVQAVQQLGQQLATSQDEAKKLKAENAALKKAAKK